MRLLAVGAIAAIAAAPITAEIEISDRGSAISVIGASDLSDLTVTSIADLVGSVPGVQSYRYGDDPTGSATLDRDTDPAATPDLLGGFVLQSDGVGYLNLQMTIESSAQYFVQSGDGLVDDQTYAFFVSSRQMPVHGASGDGSTPLTGLYRQMDWTIAYDGLAGWIPDAMYPGDTWQGASLALTATTGPGVDFSASLCDLNAGLVPIDFDGFVAWGNDWTIAAIDYGTLKDYGEHWEVGLSLRYGFSSHIHDGSMGSSPSGASIVTTYPPAPRASTDFYGFPLDRPITVTLGGDDQYAEDDGFSEWCWCWLLGGAGFGAGLGWWYLDSRRRGLPFAPAYTLRRGLDRARGVPVPPVDCEPARAKWKAAERARRAREGLVNSAKEFLDSRMARVSELQARLATYNTALRGPRGGTGGNDFARLDGQLIGYDDLKDMRDAAQQEIADARAEAERAKAEVDERLAALKKAEATEKAAQKAFDACAGGAGR